jgi:putative hemin transport protein
MTKLLITYLVNTKMMNSLTIDKVQNAYGLRKAWEGIQQAKPGIRIREAAKELGVSEAELLATKTGENCVRLKSNWASLLKRLPELGHVMSLTRNNACILEHKGSFQKIHVFGEGDRSMATVIGPIETRVFFKAWHIAFAQTEEKSGRLLKSIQVFDHSGEAITKIYLQEKSNEEAYYQILDDFRSENQSPEQEVFPYEEETYSTTVDKDSFLGEWQALKDTHDFFGMLRKHQVNRYHALEIAYDRFTYQIDPIQSPKQLLEVASASKLPIMIFAGNRGNLQIHQGKVRTIRLLERGHSGPENWLNILDPSFNMHLRQDLVDTAWVVKKPTSDGIVTAVELLDKEHKLIAQFFGLRKPGIPQNEAWSKLVADLPVL